MKKDKTYYTSLSLCLGGIFFLAGSIASKRKLPFYNKIYFISVGFFVIATVLSYKKTR